MTRVNLKFASAASWVSVVLGSSLLSGCAIDTALKQTEERVEVAQRQMTRAAEEFRVPRSSVSKQVVARPWIAGKPVTLAQEVTLPRALQAQVRTTLIFKEKKASLQEIASRVALAGAIPVRVMPDALLPASRFLPRLQDVDGTESMAPSGASMQYPMISGTFSLARILDVIAAQYDVYWRHHQGTIEFYRTETRVFDIRALTLSAESEMKLGRAGVSDNQGFQSTARTTLNLERQPVLEAIKQRLEPFLTRAAVVSAQSGSLTSIVIADTPAALDRVAAYLETVNRSMGQRVRLVFEEMTVTRKDGQQMGLDWSVAFANGLMSLGLHGADRGREGEFLSVGGGTGMAGGSITLRALSDYANVLRHTVVPVVTLNRRPVTHAVRSTFTYVDQVQALGSARSSQGDVGITQPGVAVSQKQETTGSFLTLVPDVQEDGQILLSVAYDNTVAQPLKALHFGNQDNAFQVQQLTVSGSGTVQQVALRPGRPVLIAGFEERQEESSGVRLAPGMPRVTGGMDAVSQQQRMTLIFVTAQVEEGL